MSKLWLGALLNNCGIFVRSLSRAYNQDATMLSRHVPITLLSFEDIVVLNKTRTNPPPLTNSTQPRTSRSQARIKVFVMGRLADGLETCSYLFAPQSLLVPFGPTSIIWSVFFCWWKGFAPVKILQIFSAVCIALGCLLESIGNSRHVHTEAYDWSTIRARLTSNEAYLYYSFLFCLECFIALGLWYSHRLSKESRTLLMCLRPGILAGNSFLIKAVVNMLRDTISSAWYTDQVAYILIISLMLNVSLGIYFLEEAMNDPEDYLTLMPLYDATAFALSSVSAQIIFKELKGITSGDLAFIVVGACTVVAGIYFQVLTNANKDITVKVGRARNGECCCICSVYTYVGVDQALSAATSPLELGDDEDWSIEPPSAVNVTTPSESDKVSSDNPGNGSTQGLATSK